MGKLRRCYEYGPQNPCRKSLAEWCVSVIPAMGKWSQADPEFSGCAA